MFMNAALYQLSGLFGSLQIQFRECLRERSVKSADIIFKDCNEKYLLELADFCLKSTV